MNIGSRLREEREKIGYSQEKLGAIGGVQKRAQINYEAGERLPDAGYLRGVAQVGVDVQYVLLGVRSVNLMEVFLSDDFVSETNAEHARRVFAEQRGQAIPQALPADEQALLDSYRRCKPEARVNLIQTAALLSAGMAPAAAPASKPRARAADAPAISPVVQVIRAAGSRVAGRDYHESPTKQDQDRDGSTNQRPARKGRGK